jgi:hypothetical protein
MVADTYPLLSIFLTMLEFFAFFVWIWLVISIFSDIFRSHDLGGFAKALWVILVIVVPYLGIFLYLIMRGGSMHERAVVQSQHQQEAFGAHMRHVAGSSSADQLEKLATLKEKGFITDAEFESEKSKLLA